MASVPTNEQIVESMERRFPTYAQAIHYLCNLEPTYLALKSIEKRLIEQTEQLEQELVHRTEDLEEKIKELESKDNG